jgi:hypothetical protein
MIKQSISLSIGVALAVLFLAARASAQDHVCSQQLAFALSEYGIKMSDIKNAQFRTDRFAHEGGQNGPIDDYEFTGQPAACSSGGLFMSLSTGCEIEDLHTHGDCRIKGIPHWWW